jgi:hypothetical protein
MTGPVFPALQGKFNVYPRRAAYAPPGQVSYRG